MIFEEEPDWDKSCCTTDLTVEEMLDTMKKAMAIPRPEIEELVVTKEEWLTLKKELNIQETKSLTWDNKLYGIRLWVFPTKIEVIEKAIELIYAKNRVAILEDGNVKLCKRGLDEYKHDIYSPCTWRQLFGSF